MVLLIFGTVLSIITLIASIVLTALYQKIQNKTFWSPLSLFTVGFFLSVLFFLIPIHYFEFDAQSGCYVGLGLSFENSINPFLLSLLNTLQAFINDGSTETFESAALFAQGIGGEGLRQLYTVYAALLIVGAPILTFGNVLSMFKGVFHGIRFGLISSIFGNRRVYIMSRLSNGSITLAKDIRAENLNKKLKSVIVFTDVGDETDSELISSANVIKAIILKRKISELDLSHLKHMELFLIGEDENDNVNRALEITKKINKKADRTQTVHIFAFAHSRANGCVIDSANYENLLSVKLITDLNISDMTYREPDFRLRRVDIVRQFVWNEVQKMGFFEGDCGRPLSILIAGLGTYGLEFFKTLSWFCYYYKRTLEINIVDKNPNVRSIVERYCPGLLTVNEINPRYSVECFSAIDLETSGFEKLMNESSRLKKTTHVIVSMGDDNTNTEAAIYLRELFDRADPPKDGVPPKSETDEKTHIYALLYDDYPDSVDDPKNRCLINHKDDSYSINYIGGLNAKYLYKIVYDDRFEMDSFKQHVKWSKKTCEVFSEAILQYEQYEYFRLSSMAQEMYKRTLEKRFTDISDKELDANEHNRWILYMYSLGYIYNELRNDRAKTHYDLVKFDDLDEDEKLKDKYSVNTNTITEENDHVHT